MTAEGIPVSAALHARPTAQFRPWIAVIVAALDTVALGVGFLIGLATGVPDRLLADSAVITIVVGPTFPLLAAYLLRRGEADRGSRRADRLAWLFLGLGVLGTLTSVLYTYAGYGLARQAPLALGAAWVQSWLWTSILPGLALVLLWFPTGEVPSARWRWVTRGAVAGGVALLIGTAFMPGPLGDWRLANPLGWSGGEMLLAPLAGIGRILVLGAFLAAVVSVAVRYVRGDRRIRAQVRWLLIAVIVLLITTALPGQGPLAVAVVALNVLATVLLPVTLAVALLRRDGVLLPLILRYGWLTTLLLGAYLAVVDLAGAVIGPSVDRAAALTAAALVAVVAAPLHARLQRGVERLVYGDRGDPYLALADLGRRIAGSPHQVLDEAVRAVAAALRSPGVSVVLAGDTEPISLVGRPGPEDLAVPLSLRGRAVGALTVAPRTPRSPYSRRDRVLLDDLAGHIAVAAHAATLTRDLQRSRESLVLAREEERRRIRRDLHDGLGPALAGVAFGLDAARNTLASDPGGTAAALTELKTEVHTSIADVRRLVYDLRPPALDQLGLVAALEEHGAKLGERGALAVTVDAEPLPDLPAAVEVAAYRIATEALANAARHSRAANTEVRIRVDGEGLRIEVTDDGVGLPPSSADRGTGLGLTAMSERAAELGGSCSVGPGAGGGTAVVALLPVRSGS